MSFSHSTALLILSPNTMVLEILATSLPLGIRNVRSSKLFFRIELTIYLRFGQSRGFLYIYEELGSLMDTFI